MNRKQGLIGIDPSFTGKMAGILFMGLKCPKKLIQLFNYFSNKLLKFLLYFRSQKGLNKFAQIIEKTVAHILHFEVFSK